MNNKALRIMIQYIVITAHAKSDINLIQNLAQACKQYDCSIIDSNMCLLGNENCISMFVGGNWNTIAKLETHLQHLKEQTNIHLDFSRTEMKKFKEAFLPYIIHITATDSPGITADVAHFFCQKEVCITEMNTSRYVTTKTNTIMHSINLTILIPATTSIAEFRDHFLIFCDTYNLDAVFEPDRT